MAEEWGGGGGGGGIISGITRSPVLQRQKNGDDYDTDNNGNANDYGEEWRSGRIVGRERGVGRVREGTEGGVGRGRRPNRRLVEIKSHHLISLCMQSYLVFDVVALWSSYGLVSPYFTDPKTESAQVGGVDHRSNSRSVFYWKIVAKVM